MSWKSGDGTTVEGMLFYPVDYQPGRRYPLVVQMHGGPFESDKFGAGSALVQNYWPVLAAKGYAVLRPNYRGSTGYGNAFFRDVVNGYFHNMASDIMAGVDHLVQAGIADPDRLIAMGWSAGGTLVNKLVTMTDRFKAASAGAGVVELDVALRPDRRHDVPPHLVRRDAVAEERAHRSASGTTRRSRTWRT